MIVSSECSCMAALSHAPGLRVELHVWQPHLGSATHGIARNTWTCPAAGVGRPSVECSTASQLEGSLGVQSKFLSYTDIIVSILIMKHSFH